MLRHLEACAVTLAVQVMPLHDIDWGQGVKETYSWAIQVRGKDNLGEVGPVQDGFKKTFCAAGAGVLLQKIRVSGKPIPPAEA